MHDSRKITSICDPRKVVGNSEGKLEGAGGRGGDSKANILKQKYEAKLERGQGPNFHGKGVDIFSSVLLNTVCVAVTYYP